MTSGEEQMWFSALMLQQTKEIGISGLGNQRRLYRVPRRRDGAGRGSCGGKGLAAASVPSSIVHSHPRVHWSLGVPEDVCVALV